MAKHPVLISFDDLLKGAGQITREIHKLSMGDPKHRSEWEDLEDQMLATIALISSIRGQTKQLKPKAKNV